MNSEQKYTPKYWVGHSLSTDDVFMVTASKHKDYSCKLMEKLFGEDWFVDENFDVILIEIKQVKI